MQQYEHARLPLRQCYAGSRRRKVFDRLTRESNAIFRQWACVAARFHTSADGRAQIHQALGVRFNV
jgi:hypothetical protein